MSLRSILIFAMALAAALSARAGSLRFNGAVLPPVEVDAPATTGINELYVVNTTQGLSITYTASSASASVAWQTYDMRGAAYAENVDPSLVTRSGRESTLNQLTPDCGYVIIEGSRSTYVWIADYERHPYDVEALVIDPEQECDRTALSIEGQAARMVYYSITGRAFEIDRQITLTYNTLTADNEQQTFVQTEATQSLPYISGAIHVQAPLCDTYFHLEGDRFLRRWGMAEEISSPRFTTTAVDAIVTVSQNKRESDNEVKDEEQLGGSAPAEINFNAVVSDAVVFTQWQISTDSEFEDITYRTSETDFTYTFTEMGTFFVRFMAADNAGTCEYYSDTYTINIGESQLLCPNAFSPGASEGVNDEWKVSYKSIVDFECYIFNRWGQKLFEFRDPSIGWDGKVGGKLVPAGVYYYVIKARGSDGKTYNLSGDINIVRYKIKATSSPSTEE